jgi:hypothetical protein
MHLPFSLLIVLCACAIPPAIGAEPNVTLTLVGHARIGAESDLVAVQSSDSDKARWFRVGDALAGFRFLRYDEAQDVLYISRGETVIALALKKAVVGRSAPPALSRADALAKLRADIESAKATLSKKAGYTRFDPDIVNRFDQKTRESIAAWQDRTSKKGMIGLVVGSKNGKPVYMTYSTPNFPTYVTYNLTPEDLAAFTYEMAVLLAGLEP